MSEIRPRLNKQISVKDFKEFYWLKEELVSFCRSEGLKSSGSKLQISKQITEYLRTGEKQNFSSSKAKYHSKFDWNNTTLSLETIITDNYKNTENVRTFFSAQIGKNFSFNVTFMKWFKINTGKTLEQAIVAWFEIQKEKKSSKGKAKIAPQFEYNKYFRDYFADNPNGSRRIAIQLWNLKKNQRGPNNYEKSDLGLL